ncbi:MAG: hypothetical protein JJT85_00410 [Chromatiales bacterium]|nr:hypothetical protein [Chromatiales bacterium]
MSRNLLLLLIVTACWGCSATITLPDEQAIEVPRPVFLVEHGWHTSLVLTDEQGGMVRYVYGDWRWYAEVDTGFLRVFPTLLWSTQGALGRQLMSPPATPEGIRAQSRVGITSIQPMSAPAERVDSLIERLAQRFAAAVDTQVYSPLYGLEFVHDQTPYWLGRNSNHRLVDWLRDLDVEVRGNPTLGRWRFRQDRAGR